MIGVMVALSVIGASMLNSESRLSMKTAPFTGNPPVFDAAVLFPLRHNSFCCRTQPACCLPQSGRP